MSEPKIAVIGAGQLGSRHVQGLAKADSPLSVYVVDPSEQSRKFTEDIWLQEGDMIHRHQLSFQSDLIELPEELDIVIVATNSNVRRTVIERLLQNKRVKYLVLEKFLFQNPEDYDAVHKLLSSKNVQAWVNCPLRMLPFYKELKAKLKGTQLIDYRICGANLGIGSNAIHQLDLLAFLTDRYDYTLQASLLDDGIVKSKRAGFIEFTGTLVATGSGGSHMTITSYKSGLAPIIVQMMTETLRCIIRINENRAWISEAAAGWVWQEEVYFPPLQKRLTHHVVRQLLETGDCELPTYSRSCELHLPLLELFVERYQAAMPGNVTGCPVT